MTIHEPQTGFVGAEASDDFADAEPELVSVGQRPRGGGAPAPGRRSDYRLRGLDLEAQGLAEARPPLVRSKHASRRRRRRRLMIQWVAMLTFMAATAVLLRISVIQPYSVRSTSMVPNLQPGTNVLVLRPKLLTGSIKTGDIVVFHGPNALSCRVAGDDSTELVKRVIGLPGQTIWSTKERIYIDGEPLNESGWYNPPYGEVGPTQIVPTTIPAGSYFVMGDNRTDPCDSRSFGPIAGSSLVGKVVITTTRNGHPFVHGL